MGSRHTWPRNMSSYQSLLHVMSMTATILSAACVAVLTAIPHFFLLPNAMCSNFVLPLINPGLPSHSSGLVLLAVGGFSNRVPKPEPPAAKAVVRQAPRTSSL